jgi:hypothetical protein
MIRVEITLQITLLTLVCTHNRWNLVDGTLKMEPCTRDSYTLSIPG